MQMLSLKVIKIWETKIKPCSLQTIPQKGKELMDTIFRHDTVRQAFLIP